VFIVEIPTRTGTLCERHASYEEATRRVDGYPTEDLAGLPLIFHELADGSQRLVRTDGKPLQWHRLPEDAPRSPDEPLPLSEVPPEFEGSGPQPLEWPVVEADWPEADN
jgi:hypothetical protein